jgi:ABC-type transporter Mla subunit MlaD
MSRDPASRSWSELRTGISALVAVAVATAVVFTLDVVLRELAEGPEIVVVASEARNLRPGAAVWVAGVPGGRVTGVTFQPAEEERAGRVVVQAVLRERPGDLLRSDADARIRTASLLAPAILDLRPGEASERFDPVDTLVAETPVNREDLVGRMEELFDRLERLAPDASRLTARLDEGPGTLASLRRDPDVLEELRAASAGLEELARAEGSLSRLAGDTALVERARRIRDRLASLAGPAEGADGGRWSALAADVARVGVRVDTLTARIEAGRGSAGRFLTDTELVDAVARVRARADSVRAELLAHPFRWLRFRIF